MSSINDAFRAGVAGPDSLWAVRDVLTALIVISLIGIYIYFVYKKQTKSEFYSKDFNITLPALGIITAAVIIAIQTNVLVSLGMVGALSIVRFRTAVKSPLDLAYMFWSIGAGIICGVKLYMLAVILSLIITVIVIFFVRFTEPKASAILVVRSVLDCVGYMIETEIKKRTKQSKISSLSIRGNEREAIFEVATDAATDLVSHLNAMSGVNSVTYLEHHSERRF